MEPGGYRSRHIDMPFVGTEALAAGTVNRYQLRTRYDALYRNVYVPRGQKLTAVDKAVAAWLWSKRRATVVGLSAAALHGSLWIDARQPAELNQPSRTRPPGIFIHSDVLAEDETCVVQGINATTPARTAFDLGRRKGQTLAVVRVDALLQATQLKLPEVLALAERHPGVRGLRQLEQVLDLADYGGESPQETRLRLLFTNNGMRPTRTQIDVFDGRYHVGRIDMGWPEWKVGVQYDGIQHWQDPRRRTKDIDQNAEYRELGWRLVHVGADLMRARHDIIIARTRTELRAAGAPY
ncbi:hypothetical protein [Mycolicibacterium sp. NCC-Tsukiji]|uniref:hypothetical protein n=1 Tax=Mycolicibacterium sp. NCC-Tsukiji TaxID=2185272 RepID=UPI001FCE9ABC|nr:hypothetical protein [Mycolicibacterium sp. NCC-Tsukiji]